MKSLLVILMIFASVTLEKCGTENLNLSESKEYFPLPDSLGGWRTLSNSQDVKKIVGVDPEKLDSAFDFVRTTTENGGLLVVRNGYLVYEKYFGKGQRDATPNLGSCGKSFTSIATGILMEEHPDLFPRGLDQKIFTPDYLPPNAFPLSDNRMADINLGQLLSFTAGIRGNNPVIVNGKAHEIDPVGPDGWYAVVDEYALGVKEGKMGNVPFSTKSLWCDPGGGYSYATASIHIASVMLRHITGTELEDYIESHLAGPLGWGRWGFGYKYAKQVTHTPGGGGIALRSTDMLRFCYLLLHEGRWNGKQVISKKYVRAATTASPYNPHFPYSLQFNVNTRGEVNELPKDAFWKIGSGGHCLYVVPSLDMIVWKMGGRDGQYGSNDTGLPEPEAMPNPIQPLSADSDNRGDIYTKTLEMVIASCIRP
ncbi:MAG: serine hydrolase [Proteiniphilum sp.]|nr:serine hydrolase [Proteiniphilum sp.]